MTQDNERITVCFGTDENYNIHFNYNGEEYYFCDYPDLEEELLEICLEYFKGDEVSGVRDN